LVRHYCLRRITWKRGEWGVAGKARSFLQKIITEQTRKESRKGGKRGDYDLKKKGCNLLGGERRIEEEEQKKESRKNFGRGKKKEECYTFVGRRETSRPSKKGTLTLKKVCAKGANDRVRGSDQKESPSCAKCRPKRKKVDVPRWWFIKKGRVHQQPDRLYVRRTPGTRRRSKEGGGSIGKKQSG